MTEREKIKMMVSISFGFLLLYFLSHNDIFLLVSAFFIFLSLIKKKISFLTADFMIFVFSYIYNIIFEIMIFVMYFLVMFPFSILWSFFNRKKLNYFFKNESKSMFVDFKDKIDFKTQM